MKKSAFDLEHQSQNVESKIVASLERISQAFRVLLWNESREFLLSPIQIQILIFLLKHSPNKRRISYLANEFNMTKATVSEAVKTLEQKRLIEKQVEPDDTRSYLIHLTGRGESVAEQTSFFSEQIQVPVDKMTEAAKGNLLSSLLGIIQHLNQTGVITIQRMCLTCQYYDSTNGHFCRLLDKRLADMELRIDCPEYLSV